MAKDKIVSFKADDAFIDSIKKIMDLTGKSKAAVIRTCVMRGAKVWWAELKKEETSFGFDAGNNAAQTRI